MEFQQEMGSQQTTTTETSSSTAQLTSAAEERIQLIHQLLWQEFNDPSAKEFPLWGMWK